MIDTCLINKTSGCSRLNEIESINDSNTVQIAYAYDWGVSTDTPALIHDLFYFKLKPKAEEIGINLKFQGLGGQQTGSIFCDICCQVQKSDIILFDISTHNINVIFELGLAIGSGSYIYLLRSKHQKRPMKEFTDLKGILEYRFTRRGGSLIFNGDLVGKIITNLSSIARTRAYNKK